MSFFRLITSCSLVLLAGIAWAQLPTAGKYAAAPEEWLLGNGQPWHHQTRTAHPAAALHWREPSETEKATVEKAKRLLDQSSARAMALLDGPHVVWVGYKFPASAARRYLSFSIGKTVTAMAVGQAICDHKMALETPIGQLIPELAGWDLGLARVEDLLKMSSGTWAGNADSTILTAEQDQRLRNGSMSFLDVLTTLPVPAADKDARGAPRKPGSYFVYHSTDPLALGVALHQATGTTYAKYVENRVLLAAGIERPGIIGQDRHGYGAADGNIRLFLEDWIRFAVWVKASETGQGCFSDYVRRATRTQIANQSKKSGASFDGYGYFIWTENNKRRDSFWAVGHGGQRIGWNHANHRMLIAFSTVENYMGELYALYADWAALGDAKNESR